MPFRMGRDEAEVLLVTSRETKRWILPKGNPERKKKSYEVAAAEAFEEAGLKGKASEKPFYTFDSVKRMKSGKMVPCRVRVFSLAVKKEYARWPEKDERERAWMSFAEAANNAGEAGLVLLFLELAADPDLALEKIKPHLTAGKPKSKGKKPPKGKPKLKVKAKAKAKAKPKLKVKAKTKPKLKVKAKLKVKSKLKPKSKTKTKAKTKAKKGAA
ncbi:Diphosphoinositol polyphosphate phosphohydrolase 3-alpha (modular protein) [Rhodospirillaceae bacterium LM-1]|nr:Diphosphoinositol polyphosphate phosphohydrolase 3-alpha (modular protein) [Rhodospirillaceae bacterium LM-1]